MVNSYLTELVSQSLNISADSKSGTSPGPSVSIVPMEELEGSKGSLC